MCMNQLARAQIFLLLRTAPFFRRINYKLQFKIDYAPKICILCNFVMIKWVGRFFEQILLKTSQSKQAVQEIRQLQEIAGNARVAKKKGNMKY